MTPRDNRLERARATQQVNLRVTRQVRRQVTLRAMSQATRQVILRETLAVSRGATLVELSSKLATPRATPADRPHLIQRRRSLSLRRRR